MFYHMVKCHIGSPRYYFLFGAIPYIGESLEVWVRGDYYISGITISRFFALHVVALPLILIALVFLHLVAFMKLVLVIQKELILRNLLMKMEFLLIAYLSSLTKF